MRRIPQAAPEFHRQGAQNSRRRVHCYENIMDIGGKATFSSMDFELQSIFPVRHSRASPRMLQNIPDLMASMSQLDEESVQRIRKTAEDPPRVSVFDVLQAVTCY